MAGIRASATLVLFVAVGAAPLLAQQGPTQAQLNAAHENTTDWLHSNHDYGGQRFVDLQIIHRDNVTSLRPVCMYQTGYSGGFQTSPVVYDGVMYLTAGNSTMAIEATTCRLRWRHNWPTGRGNQRGVALKEGKVVRASRDGHLLALDADTGELLWETTAADREKFESFAMPPVVYEDLVIIGPAGSERGVRGWVGAFRLEDGEPVWKFNTVPLPGEPGAETWSDIESELIGGGAVWTPFSLDPRAGLVFVPVANPAPDFYDDARLGDNLYTSTMVVLDARSGQLRWYYQAVPHDTHDWDLTQASPLFAGTVNGQRRQLVTTAGKDGLLHVLDRETHEHLFEVPVTRRENTGAPLTVEGVRACPGVLGGVQWNGPAYNPGLNMLYTPAVDQCGTYQKAAAPRIAPGSSYMGGRFIRDPEEDTRGWVTAVDVSTGTIRWRYESPKPMLAAVTTTSAELLFTGEIDGDFLVLDARDGSVLYRFNTGAPITGGIVTYGIDGRQYVGVMSGNTSGLWRSLLSNYNTPDGASPATGTVIVFGLP